MTISVYQGAHYVSTAGIVSTVPLYIEGILFVPHAITDVIDLNFWDEANATTASDLFLKASAASGTVTDDSSGSRDIITSTAFPDAGVVKVLATSGLVANKKYHLIGIQGDNDAFIVDPAASWGDENNVNYHIICYPARDFYNCSFSGITNDFESKYVYMGGVYVPNLACNAVTSGSYAIIYTR
jgi:hypothetical protein